MNTLLPDYSEIEKIFIVSPIGTRENLWDEFEFFINVLSGIIDKKDKGQRIVVVCESDSSKNITEEKLINKHNVDFFVCKVSDIWIRDYFSCANMVTDNCKELTTLKGLYHPSYNSHYAAIDDAAGTILSQKFFENICTLPFKLDGGNVISNSDYMFISENLYKENFYFGKGVINKFFEDDFKQKLVTLPTEILDVVGHTDCILRFIDDKTILLPIYDATYRVDNRYIMTVKRQLVETLGVDYNYIFLPSYLDDQINDDNIFSAKGLYLNYFRFEDNIIFPSFEGLKDYETEIVRIINKVAPNLILYFSPCDKIAFEGGCFNCITNTKYKV